jgi:hypothetical protein
MRSEHDFVDLGTWFTGEKPSQVYCDWEGFVSADAVMAAWEKLFIDANKTPEERKRDCREVYGSEVFDVAKTLTLHFIHQRGDTYEIPNEDEVRAVWEFTIELLGTRRWMKETAV